jgi:initiation factor 1A
MPKNNQKGGKNFKKGKKKTGLVKNNEPKKTESYQRYAQIEKKLGGNMMDLTCSDGEKRHGIIPGKMHKRVWMYAGDIVLVELNSDLNQNAKIQECFITHKYSNHAANNLKSLGEINFNVKSDDTMTDDTIKFGDDSSKLSDYNDVYAEMDKLDNENKTDGGKTEEEKKKIRETQDTKDAKKRALKEKNKIQDILRQDSRSKKDTTDNEVFDFDSI